MYVYCGCCSFSQDDFWTLKYNPFTQLMRDISWLWVPRMVETESRVFSWKWLAQCFVWRITAPFTQKWWTYSSWKKAVSKNGGKYPPCPRCGKALFTD